MKPMFFICIFLIFYTMIGYPIILKVLNKIVKKDKVLFDSTYEPKVTIIIPVHNEEKVIEKKLINLISLDYPENKKEIIITSDNSVDQTNSIVYEYSLKYPNIKLVEVQKRMGKTNAQDEAVSEATGEIIVFSDANSILDVRAIKEIVKYMFDSSISYVAGKLEYTNKDLNSAADSEDSYWNYDLEMRQIESNISSITAGNGALYGVRKSEYIKIDPIYSHDSVFPPKFVVLGKKAKFNPKAVAYEKAGESIEDEFKRKVRMSRKIIKINFIDIKKYNIFQYGYFSFFYFSHRLCRNFLFLLHIGAFITNLFLINNRYFLMIFICQIIFYLLSVIGYFFDNKYLKVFTYYSMTISAQLIGAFKEITGKSKPFWEVVESTR